MKLHILESVDTNANLLYMKQDDMKVVWDYIEQVQPNAISLTSAGGYISSNDLKPKYLYYMAEQLATQTANKDNYFNNSVGFWTKVSRKPKGEPDYISGKLKGSSVDTINYIKSGSSYWYTSEGVYRSSNHWGRNIASCSWFVDDENPRRTTAFIKWEDLKPKGNLYMWTIDAIQNTPNILKNFEGVELNDYMFKPEGFTFEKPKYFY